eukprot:m.39292 g.39292  ORF g.39292 m.39292 type:complete len:472 (-) comp18164_c0_seq1:366-1781(-)
MGGLKLSVQRGIRSERRTACLIPSSYDVESEISGTQPQWRYPLVQTDVTRNVDAIVTKESPHVQAVLECEYWARQKEVNENKHRDFDKALRERLSSVSQRKRKMFQERVLDAHDRDERTVNTSLHGSVHVVAPVVVRGVSGQKEHSILKSVNKGGAAVEHDGDTSASHVDSNISVHDLSQFARNQLLSCSSKGTPSVPNLAKDNTYIASDGGGDTDNDSNDSGSSQNESQPLFDITGYNMAETSSLTTETNDRLSNSGNEHDSHPNTGRHHHRCQENRYDNHDECDDVTDVNVAKHTFFCTQTFKQEKQREDERQAKAALALRRKLYMSIEREQARNYAQTRDHLKRSKQARFRKEDDRVRAESQLSQSMEISHQDSESSDVMSDLMRELKLEEKIVRKEIKKRQVELDRYSVALRKQLEERCQTNKVAFQSPNCCVGMELYGHCANNCPYYKHKRGYVKLLTRMYPTCNM